VRGPTFGAGNLGVRVGARWRTLPYSAGPDAVTERSLSAGLGFPMARDRSELNIGIVRSTRGGYSGVTESAWTLSTGFSVRP
jgi:hypothetical protein